MTLVSSFLAQSGGIPLGDFWVGAPDLAPYLTVGTQEHLRIDQSVAYQAKYLRAIRYNPLLARYGSSAIASGVVSNLANGIPRIAHDGTRYHLQIADNINVRSYYSTDLVTWTGPTTVVSADQTDGGLSGRNGFIAAGGGGVACIWDNGGARTLYTATGTGAFTSRATLSTTPSFIAFNGTNWLVVWSGNYGTIANANPDGAWTTGATTNGFTTIIGLDGSSSVWAGLTASSGTATIKTSPTGETWTSRSSPAELGTTGDKYVTPTYTPLVWTGSAFVFPVFLSASGQCRLARSTDGTTWTLDSADIPGAVAPVTGSNLNSLHVHLSTDRGGKLMLSFSVAAGASQQSYSPTIFYSADHGVTWSQARLASAGVPYSAAWRPNAVVYANDRFFANPWCGNPQVRLVGATPAELTGATPQFVGPVPEVAGSTTTFARIR